MKKIYANKVTILIFTIFICCYGNSVLAQKIKRQKESMQYKQLPLKPLKKNSYYVVIDEAYLKATKDTQDLTMEKLQEAARKEAEKKKATKTTGKKIVENIIANSMSTEMLLRILVMSIEEQNEKRKEIARNKRNCYAYSQESAIKNVGIKGLIKSTSLDSADYIITVSPKNTSFRNYERAVSSKFAYEIIGVLNLNYTIHTKSGDLISEGTVKGGTNKQLTPKYTTKEELIRVWNAVPNDSILIKSIESWHQNVFIKAGNSLTTALSDDFGTYNKNRDFTLFKVNPKKYKYPEFELALSQLVNGLKTLTNNLDKSKELLKLSITGFEQIIDAYEPGNRRAKINDNVAGAAYYNVAEAYLWLKNYEQSNKYLDLIISKDLGKPVKRAKALLKLVENLQAREKANNQI